MITFTLHNGLVATLRTSGTEPKIKCYAEYCAAPGNRSADSSSTLSRRVEASWVRECCPRWLAVALPRRPSQVKQISCPTLCVQVGVASLRVSVSQRRVQAGGGAAKVHGCSAGRVPGA